MMQTKLRRRAFCRFLSYSSVLALMPSMNILANQALNKPVIFAGGDDEHFYIGQYTGEAAPKMIELGYRIHQILPLGGQRYLAISRRPETWIAWIDFDTQSIDQVHEVEAGYHLYGHACIDHLNNILLTTENDIVTQQGYVVLRDLKSLQIVARYPSHGLGPHQLLLDSHNEQLWVANGGFLLAPTSGRAIRNRVDFNSSLVLMDYRNGKLLTSVQHPDKQQSMRHLALLDETTIAIGLQHHGTGRPSNFSPYAVWRLGEALTTYHNAHAKQNYVTTVMAIDQHRFAVSMEKDNEVEVIDINSEQRQARTIDTPQGLMMNGDSIYISNKTGNLLSFSSKQFNSGSGVVLLSLPAGFWFDNHFLLG